MFQPDQAALLAWTSPSVLGTVRHDPDIHETRLTTVGCSTAEGPNVRALAFTTGVAILLLVLSLILLATGANTSHRDAVAAPVAGPAVATKNVWP